MTKDQSNPDNLLSRIKQGDLTAFDILYTKYFSPIYRFIFYKTNNKELSEDITQDVFIRFFDHRANYRAGGRNPKAYLLKIANNLIIDYWRKKRDNIMDEEKNVFEKFISEREELNKKIDDKSDISIIQKAINSLSPKQKNTILMRFVAELSYKEIALELGESESTVRQHVCRGLKKIRKYTEVINKTGFKFKNIVSTVLINLFIG